MAGNDKSAAGALRWAAIVCLACVGSSALATQLVAKRAKYDPALGEPWLSEGATPLYNPLEFWSWWMQWGKEAPRAFSLGFAIIGLCLLCVVFVAVKQFERARKLRPTGGYGTARWATKKEIEKDGLLDADGGIVLGQEYAAEFRSKGSGKNEVWKQKRVGRLLRDDGPGHTLLAAETRGGKGLSTIIPTLLTWRASTVVYDLKQENWVQTAGWRRLFSRVLCFEPADRRSVCWNPLLAIRPEADVADAQMIAHIVTVVGDKDSYWTQAATDLVGAVILHVLYTEDDKALPRVLQVLTNPEQGVLATFDQMRTGTYPSPAAQELINGTGRAMLDRAPNERSGVLNTATTPLSLYRDPNVARAVSRSDFTIEDLVYGKEPVSLYFVVKYADQPRMKPLVRLLFSFVAARLTETLEKPRPYVPGRAVRGWRRAAAAVGAAWAGPGRAATSPRWWARAWEVLASSQTPPGATVRRHRLLMLMDEFPAAGRMEAVENALPVMAGYGMKALITVQTLDQLEAVYGKNNAIIDNCQTRIFFAAPTGEKVSKWLGTQSLMRVQHSESGRGFLPQRNKSESYQEFGRPLLTPEEITGLPFTDALILRSRSHPVRAKKVMYYLDPRFRERAGLPAPESRKERRRELPRKRRESPWAQFTQDKWQQRMGGVAADGAASVLPATSGGGGQQPDSKRPDSQRRQEEAISIDREVDGFHQDVFGSRDEAPKSSSSTSADPGLQSPPTLDTMQPYQ